MKLNTIIIDDEQHCIDTLSYDLQRRCDEMIALVGHGKNAIEATALINSKKPDLIFLDIELPGMNGLEFLDAVGELDADVVLTTAHSKYAIEGYKFNVTAYLLKPVDPHDLQKVVAGIHEKKKELNRSLLTEKLAIADAKGIEFISHEDIISCQSDNNYTIIFLNDGTQKVVSKTLKYIESQLPSSHFVRIHHSTIINLMHVKKYLKSDGGQVEMKNGAIYGLSKRYKDDFLALLQG